MLMYVLSIGRIQRNKPVLHLWTVLTKYFSILVNFLLMKSGFFISRTCIEVIIKVFKDVVDAYSGIFHSLF